MILSQNLLPQNWLKPFIVEIFVVTRNLNKINPRPFLENDFWITTNFLSRLLAGHIILNEPRSRVVAVKVGGGAPFSLFTNDKSSWNKDWGQMRELLE